jgi:putative endonuclease
MTDPRHTLGLRMEGAVARWLEAAGWHVVARRARAPGGGEVDVVAVDPDGVLVAVEVRARRSARTGAAAATVDRPRVVRLRRTLAVLGRGSPVPSRGMRVDLVAAEPIAGTADRWRLQRIPGIDAD